MSVPAVIFEMMEKRQGQVVTWWSAARREFAAMRALIPMMVCELGLPAAPMVFATDSEGANNHDHGGFGVVATNISGEQAEALLAAGTRPGHTVSRLNGTVAHLERSDRELRRRIP
eukprot:4807760-Pyramimonas_sp.AAC.2